VGIVMMMIGAVLIVASLIIERVQDAKEEADLLQDQASP